MNIISALGSLTLFTIIFLIFGSAFAVEIKDVNRTLNVQGQGQIYSTPDVATIKFSVETQSKNASDAVSENAKNTNSVIESLKPKLGKKDKLYTAGYSLAPINEYNNQTRKSEFKGFRASNNIIVETINLKDVGALIDRASQAGLNRVESLSFSSNNRDDLRTQALEKAVKDAKDTAQVVAKAAGVEIVRIQQIMPSYNFPHPVYADFSDRRMSTAEAAPPPPTPIAPGELTTTAYVNIVFEIK